MEWGALRDMLVSNLASTNPAIHPTKTPRYHPLRDPPPPHHHHHYDQYEACISRVIMIRTCMKRIRGLNVQAEADRGVLKPATSPGAGPRSTPQADLDVLVILDS